MTTETHTRYGLVEGTHGLVDGSHGLNGRFVSRTARVTDRMGDRSVFVEPTPHWTTRDVWQAVQGYAVARLAEGRSADGSRADRAFRYQNARDWTDYLSDRGLSGEAIIRHQIGLIPSLDEARDHLRSLGFSDYDVDQSTFAETAATAAGNGCDMLLVPVVGVPGQPSGFAMRCRGEDRGDWQTVFHGPVTSHASHLAYDHIIVTTDPVEALALRDAGVSEAYAVPTSFSGQVSFWESLAEHGVDRVTMVTSAAFGEWDRLQHAAEAACEARCTPAVDLFELPPAHGRSIAFYVNKIGPESFRRELARRYEPQPTSAPAAQAFDTVQYWAAVRPQLAAISDTHTRRQHERLASEVAELLASGRYVNASQAIDAALEGNGVAILPRSTSHHVEYVRSASARDAMAARLFDLLRTTTGHVTVVTPLAFDEFVEMVAHHASEASKAGRDEKFTVRFAGRTIDMLRSELQTYGHRLQIISTPRPTSFNESSTRLIHHTDLIVVDATGQAQTFWWQENGSAAHLTELAEEADCDLIAFWAVDRTDRKSDYEPHLISTLREFANFVL